MKLIAALAYTLGLSFVAACGSDDVTIPTDQGDVSVSKDGSKIDIESEDGSVKGGSGKLPAGFPADEVPLVDGEILTAIAVDQTGGGGWSISILADGGAEGRHSEAISLLKAAGFEADAEQTVTGTAMTILVADDYRVLLGSTPQDGQTLMQYTVERRMD